MGLKVVRVDTGTPHPRTVWGQWIGPQTEEVVRAQAEKIVANYTAHGGIDKAWFERNACKVGRPIEKPMIGVIWEEFLENEFGLEIP
jgi:hypothetical protein